MGNPSGDLEFEAEASTGVRVQFAKAFDLGAEGFRAMSKRFDNGTVTRRHMDGEQPGVGVLAQCQNVMFHARAAQVNHARFTDDFGQTPDVAIELGGFGKISHAELDAANSYYSRVDFSLCYVLKVSAAFSRSHSFLDHPAKGRQTSLVNLCVSLKRALAHCRILHRHAIRVCHCDM